MATRAREQADAPTLVIRPAAGVLNHIDQADLDFKRLGELVQESEELERRLDKWCGQYADIQERIAARGYEGGELRRAKWFLGGLAMWKAEQDLRQRVARERAQA